MPESRSLSIDVLFDLICPWCLIGKKHLDAAIAQIRAELPDLSVAVEWRSLPLIPETPLEGVPYRAFYLARLGSAANVAMRQAQVRAAAHGAGLTLALDRIEVFPNTLLAHRLIRFVREDHGAPAAAQLVDNLFSRYFLRAENIGDAQVLRAALDECGIALPGDPDVRLHHDLSWLPSLESTFDPLHSHGTGVPSFIFDGRLALSGAHPPAVLVAAMHRALAQDVDVVHD